MKGEVVEAGKAVKKLKEKEVCLHFFLSSSLRTQVQLSSQLAELEQERDETLATILTIKQEINKFDTEVSLSPPLLPSFSPTDL